MMEFIFDKGRRTSQIYKVAINNKQLEKASAYKNEEGRIDIEVPDQEDAHIIWQLTLSDLPKEVHWLGFDSPLKGEAFDGVIIDYNGILVYESGEIDIFFDFVFDAGNWKQLWSISEYRKALSAIVQDEFGDHAFYTESEEDVINGIGIGMPIEENNRFDTPIIEIIRELLPEFKRIHQQTISILTKNVQERTIITLFDFPQEVRTSCSQYLLYFADFLKDIGIEASTEIRDQAGQTLFSVIPKDADQALENIRLALNLYLRLPISNTTSVTLPMDTDVQVQRLAANIYHLRGQLALASATIQQKENLIQQQQNFIQQQLLSGQILIESVKKESVEEEKEPVVGDIVKVKKYEWEFLEVDLPTLLRRLKDMFRK